MDVLQSEDIEDMLIDETINTDPLASISQQQNETVTELNMFNSRKRQREVKQTTEETSSEKKRRHDRETSKYEFITSLIPSICLVNYTDQDEDVKEFQMITNHELGELKVH